MLALGAPSPAELPRTATPLAFGEHAYKFKCFGTWCTDTARQAFPDADGAGKSHRCIIRGVSSAPSDVTRGYGIVVPGAEAASSALSLVRAEVARLQADAADAPGAGEDAKRTGIRRELRDLLARMIELADEVESARRRRAASARLASLQQVTAAAPTASVLEGGAGSKRGRGWPGSDLAADGSGRSRAAPSLPEIRRRHASSAMLGRLPAAATAAASRRGADEDRDESGADEPRGISGGGHLLVCAGGECLVVSSRLVSNRTCVCSPLTPAEP